MISTVQIRLIAGSEAEARAAIEALRSAVGAARIAFQAPRLGHRDDQWLAYGTFQFDADEPPTITVPPAATGPTTRLAETSKTRKLRRP